MRCRAGLSRRGTRLTTLPSRTRTSKPRNDSGERIGQRRRVGENLAEAVGPLGQEGFADSGRQMAEFVIGRGQGGVEGAVLLGVAKALVPGAVGFQQGIADQLSHQGEGNLLLVGAAAVAVVEDVEVMVVADELPQGQNGLGQRRRDNTSRSKS